MAYPDVDPRPNFPRLEEDVLARWAKDDTFQASIDQRDAGEDGSNEFVFYDGPPFANGLPHYGHLLTGYAKDTVPRFKTMQGYRVERRFGWDTHGLPAEVEAERQLKISGRPEIEKFGIDKFNDYCKVSVLQYTADWERYVTRQARWVDFTNDYKTLDTSYMESVMWAFKTLWDKGLIYEGFRVLPYSWALETPLSNSETRMDDAYKMVQDPALTVGFVLESGDNLLAWTTTPWTLPSNLALAVAPDVDYVRVRHNDKVYVLAEARLAAYAKELDGAEVLGTVRGSELVGQRYTPLVGDEPVAESGLASWYGRKFHGRPTASGEPYDMYAMTAAHKTMPIPSYARVTNLANGRSVKVSSSYSFVELSATDTTLRIDAWTNKGQSLDQAVLTR